MSRLEAVAKAGYYPTPPSVVERVAALVRPAHPTTRQAVRLLIMATPWGEQPRYLIRDREIKRGRDAGRRRDPCLQGAFVQ